LQNDAKPAPTPAFPPEVTAQIDELTKLHVSACRRARWTSNIGLQAEYEAARKAMSAERRALESKYQTLYSDIYKKRSVVISGESAKAVPDFWLTAFKNNRVIADFVEPHDEDAIKALLDVQVEYLDNFAVSACRSQSPDFYRFTGMLKGFKLSFIFAENEWFEDRVLTKSIYIDDILEATDPAINKLEGCVLIFMTIDHVVTQLLYAAALKSTGRRGRI
jgi:nucleosome assembly protein 1-like 1